jgi:transketolase
MAWAGRSAHIGCALSLVEILAVLHRNWLRYPGNNPDAEGRDYLLLSKGHGVMAQYACMRERGWIGDADMDTYFHDGTPLFGLSDARVAGLECTSGSLGHGFSVGVGLAFAAKRKNTGQKTFVVVGDGEINEGPVWEGALFAAQQALSDFTVIVDKNGFQAMGRTRDILNLGSLAEKFAAFGFATAEVDGHDETALDNALKAFETGAGGRPRALVAKTIKGKGIPFMEGNNAWHYTRLNNETREQALAALGGVAP